MPYPRAMSCTAAMIEISRASSCRGLRGFAISNVIRGPSVTSTAARMAARWNMPVRYQPGQRYHPKYTKLSEIDRTSALPAKWSANAFNRNFMLRIFYKQHFAWKRPPHPARSICERLHKQPRRFENCGNRGQGRHHLYGECSGTGMFNACAANAHWSATSSICIQTGLPAPWPARVSMRIRTGLPQIWAVCSAAANL